MSDLSTRLVAAKLTGYSLPYDERGYVLRRHLNDEEAAHLAAKVFREYLQSDATVERVARALLVSDDPQWDDLGTNAQAFYLERASRAVAALAAALASEGEARNGAA